MRRARPRNELLLYLCMHARCLCYSAGNFILIEINHLSKNANAQAGMEMQMRVDAKTNTSHKIRFEAPKPMSPKPSEVNSTRRAVKRFTHQQWKICGLWLAASLSISEKLMNKWMLNADSEWLLLYLSSLNTTDCSGWGGNWTGASGQYVFECVCGKVWTQNKHFCFVRSLVFEVIESIEW